MKKQIIICAALIGFAVSSFAQGQAAFYTTGKNWSYDNFSTQNSSQVGGSAGQNIYYALLIGAANTTSAIGAGNPTSNTSVPSSDWSTILNDPNFSFVDNASNGQLAIGTVNTANLTKGGFSYNGGSSFTVQGFGSTLANTTVSMYVIAWDANYATPQLAAAANAALGWSSVFQYTLQKDTSTTPSSLNAAGLSAFGVSRVVPAPEPGTMALAGLGIAGLLALRRKK